MKHAIAVSFIFLYFLGMIRPMAPVIEYLVNQDYIAEYLCLEKDEPITVCKGQCYLANKISQSSQQNEQAALPQIDYSQYPIAPIYQSAIEFNSGAIEIAGYSSYFNHYSFLRSHTLLKPPIS